MGRLRRITLVNCRTLPRNAPPGTHPASALAGQTVRSWHRHVAPLLVFLIQFGIVVVISQFRLVDGDGGFYLMTCRLVTGRKPPRYDFLPRQSTTCPDDRTDDLRVRRG